MGIKRVIVGAGERISHFCAHDLRTCHYRYLYLYYAKRGIGRAEYIHDPAYEKESKKYWKEYAGISISPIWHGFYSSRNGIKDVRYVPENVYYAYIESYLNKIELCQAWDDKCYYSERFPSESLPEGGTRPEIIFRNISGIFYDKDFQIVSDKQAASLLADRSIGCVVKESLTGRGGKRITFVEPGERKTTEDWQEIFARYHRDYVIEGLITQCAEMAALNPSSINTVRFITYLDRGGVHLLSVCARIGRGHSRTDNFSSGGIACGVDENGVLKSVAYDQKYNKYEHHPDGHEFAGAKIPNFNGAKRFVTEMHCRFGHFRIISWDIAIAPDYSPVLIEFNLTPQSVDLHQINNGPLFGIFTEQMLKEVFKKEKKVKEISRW